ncbi:MAG: 5'-3' exonuclease H3TH domain-containing protein [Planctomycetota bacterium]
MTGSVLLLDTMPLVYRAHHLNPPALTGLAAFVDEMRAKVGATRVVCARDTPAPSFRRELSGVYKANRRRTPQAILAQMPDLDACLAGVGAEVYRVPGFEADDILATVARELRERAERGLVVSCDRDMVALAHGGIELLLLWQHRRGERRFDERTVRRRFGVHPSLFGEWLAFKGDKGDGVPGVPGLHPRDAARLVTEWGSAAGVLENLGSVRPPTLRRLIETHAERIRANARVLPLRDDVPLS